MGLPNYRVKQDALIKDQAGRVPLIYWPVTPNFGDLLSPWLFEKLTDCSIAHVPAKVVPSNGVVRFLKEISARGPERHPNYVGIGSIMSRVRDRSVVWGTGAFGTEQKGQLNKRAQYHAVRGPLSRQLLLNRGLEIPEVYGDPALLAPLFAEAPKEKTHEIGLVLRWSEFEWIKAEAGTGVTLIDLGSSDVDGTLAKILSCKRVITSSLHGLIIADAFGIPNAFLGSKTPKGGIFKYLDYFASVSKFRKPTTFDVASERLDIANLEAKFEFDDRPIDFNSDDLLRACPFLEPV